jgi:hypothetical protein
VLHTRVIERLQHRTKLVVEIHVEIIPTAG